MLFDPAAAEDKEVARAARDRGRAGGYFVVDAPWPEGQGEILERPAETRCADACAFANGDERHDRAGRAFEA